MAIEAIILHMLAALALVTLYTTHILLNVSLRSLPSIKLEMVLAMLVIFIIDSLRSLDVHRTQNHKNTMTELLHDMWMTINITTY